MQEQISEPWDHQKIGSQKIFEHQYFMLSFDCGCGKSRALIDGLRMIYAENKSLMRTLIISPLITLENWKNEWKKFSKVSPSDVIALHGSGTNKCTQVSKIKGQNKIIITNYESLLNEELIAELLDWGIQIMVCDEIHKIKTPTSKRTKACIKLSRQASRRYGLTGTMVTNTLMDVFSQVLFLDHGKSFGEKFIFFKMKYFFDANAYMSRRTYFPNWKVRKETAEQLKNIISGISMSAKKEDCLTLPPYVQMDRFIELTGDQRKAYTSMEKEFVAFIGSEYCSADIAIVKGIRLQQICSGFLPLDNGECSSFKDNPRAAALKELLEDLTPNHKVIVWANFKKNYEDIRQVCMDLGIKWVEITGEISQPMRVEAMRLLDEDKNIRVCIGNPVSSGIGINLVAASYSIVYSRNFNLEADIQSAARNYRGGSNVHEKITRIDLVATGTIDELIKKALAEKKSIGDALINHYKKQLAK